MSIIRSSTAIEAAWTDRFSKSHVAVLYKHSPTCGLSDIALDEIEAFSASHPDVPVYLLDVLQQRPLSNQIESALGVRHESPQAIVMREGAVVWHGSHRRVLRISLEEQVRSAN